MTDFDSELAQFTALMQQLQAQPAIGARPLGVAQWDWRLWRMGREWLARPASAHAGEHGGADGAAAAHDVYVATQIYEIGGHTALIGDFVRALGHGSAHVVVTDLFGQSPAPVPDAIVSRLGLPADHVSVLPGPSHGDRLQQLFDVLRALRPDRLFLFHHPQDPLASVVAQPEVARQRILVHHADATPSFGLHVPGILTIDLNPTALALARSLGRESTLLPLTSPDPGPRPHGFLRRGHLVTASSGSAHKFAGRYALGYADTVGVILRATGGRHVHVGPLGDEALAEIGGVLACEGVSSDRFVHVHSTTSIAAALWEHDCDVYCASFPIDGARTKAEVLASGTPYLRHLARALPDSPADSTRDAEGLCVWRTWDDLTATLQRLSVMEALREHSACARQIYERHHHPDVFARTLTRILDGRTDPAEVLPARMEVAAQSLVGALVANRVHDAPVHDVLRAVQQTLSDVRAALASDSERLDGVQTRHDDWMRRLEGELTRLEAQGVELRSAMTSARAGSDVRVSSLEAALEGLQQARAVELAELRRQVERLRAEQDHWKSGTGLRAALRRWLTPS